MTPVVDQHPADSHPPRSPWLSIWFKPGEAIERVISAKSRPTMLILAALGGASGLVAAGFGYGWRAALMDWSHLGIVIAVGFIAGVVSLFFNAFFLKLSGMPLGGHASQAHLRAALAWSLVPLVFGLAICLAAVIGLKLAGAVDSSQPAFRAVDVGLTAITTVLGLWTVVITIATVKRIQRFGVWRAIANVAIGWILGGVALAFLIRSFLFQPFSIPSGAMMPTLLIGDYIFVSKYAYGYTHFSLPFSPPLFAGRILPAEPQRGDVVVFRLPKDTATDYVKRLVGLPGDRIQMKDGLLYINGTPVARERVEDFIDDEGPAGVERVRRWRETLPNGVSHETLDLQENGFLDDTQEYVVPAGHYFMMGDNRDNSTDSRVLSQVGYVPFENLIGRVEIVHFSVNGVNQAQPRIRYERIGTAVR
jgi:signal peptidase I